jgi:hypothetical protein
MPRGDKNDNRKRKPVILFTGKKARKLSKKRAKLEKLQEVTGKTSQKEGFHNLNSVEISVQRILAVHLNEAI